MNNIVYTVILLLGIIAYSTGVYQMLSNRHYQPSLFSRAIWFLLSINSYFGVVLSNGSTPSQVLAAVLLIGNGAMFLVSIKYGSRDFGIVEKISLALLAISGVVWITLDAALLNLIIGLVAHFIGGIPTFNREIKNPRNEQAYHWYFFFVASIISILASSDKSLSAILFPVYFACFDGSVILLANRRRFGFRK